MVFQEGDDASPSFKPSMIRSHFTLINGEKATLETPTFAQKRQRTLDMLIRSLYQDLMPDLHKNMLNRRSFSDVLPESPKSARKKEEALKLKTIVRGDAPTSLVTTGLCRKESLLVATDTAGVMLLDEQLAAPAAQVFDKTLVVKQMHVLEPQDLLVTRADKGKDARLYVFRLGSLKRGLEEKQAVRTKCDSRENKLEKTKGCHLYSINTHHGSELRIVAAIRNKLLLITRKQPRPEGSGAMATGADSPIEEFQYIREICLCDPPVVMALVDGPTGENDNMICVAYKHQFDLINESTGDAYRVNFVGAIDVYEDGEAGLLLCFNYSCYYKKVCPFNGSTPMIQANASDFHFSWNQMPNAIVCAFPYILAFTTDSIEIRLVVNGNLVYTAVVPELQLTASRSDIYFVSSAPVNSASSCSSRDTSSQSSPQTPTGYEMPVFPSPLSDDSIRIPYGTKLSLYMSKDSEVACKHIFKIPLSNLVGRSIERPLKSPLVHKVLTAPASAVIKEIASRTRKELLGLTEEPSGKPDSGAMRQRRMSRKDIQEEEPKPQRALTSVNSDSMAPESPDTDPDTQHCLSSVEPEPERGPPAAFTLSSSFGDVLDLK
ncbi:hypothetical protein NHX12_028032 [Muraenolepis orangiensis]|uniref:CNH domain-containing protein n=1 Tax=Muraenolepis orangiensis TaxID=630683 RepID=A0A9Q0EES3_9TELE|nr:hypothetical protein NHX12_028032 [Muraenolepis orangiensis]